MSSSCKVVVIGLDGADWRLLHPWMEAGYLPTLKRLVQEGVYGRLQSTIRPESSVAWSTFATGVNPGKHSVYGFVRHKPGTYDFYLADARHVAVPRFWDYLGDAGNKVALVNIPFTYPPKQVNGYLIGGMLTPGAHVTFTYPDTLQTRLLQQFQNNYLFDAGDNIQDKAKLVEHVSAYTQQQLQTALLLLEETWDCFTVVFTGPDRLQHFLWSDMEAPHSAHQPADQSCLGSALRYHYEVLDRAIGQIMVKLPENTLLLLISDHGFNGVGRRFYLNRWLQDRGYLVLHKGKTQAKHPLERLAFLKNIPLTRYIKRTFLPQSWGPAQLKTANFSRPIDWTKTRVYFAPDGGLRINLQGREPQGIVKPSEYESLREVLIAELCKVTDPDTNNSPIAAVYTREQLYQGAYVQKAPDLIVEPQRDQPTVDCNYVLDTNLQGVGIPFASSEPYSGNHAPEGIFIGWGTPVTVHQSLPDLHLMDVAPTILAAMGVPIPDNMDGDVLLSLFADDYRPQPTYVPVNQSRLSQLELPVDEEIDTAVEERLRNLGYLD